MASEAVLPLYAAIDTDVCRNFLLEKVLELIYDPNLEVKANTIKMLVDLLDYITKPEQREKIAGVFGELAVQLKEEVILAISSRLGMIIQKVAPVYQ